MNANPTTYKAALVVDDQPEVRTALASMVREGFPGIVVDEAQDVRAGLALLREGSPYQLALIDLGLPDGSGLTLVRRVLETSPLAAVIIATVYDDDDHVFPALAAGATGYVLKDCDPVSLSERLRQLAHGTPALSPSIARKVLAWFRTHPTTIDAPGADRPSLTPRETEVLSLIGRGLRRSEVAATLGLSDQTIASYVKVIYRKLEISSRAEAALEASRRGLT